MTDWKLVSEGINGIHWLMESHKVENANLNLMQLYSKCFGHNNTGQSLLNNGVLIMSSYLLFVYPQESDFDNINFEKIDITCFNIKKQESVHDNKKFCCRLRNSLSHSRFVINSENIICFNDETKSGGDRIDFEIGTVEFGNFIFQFSDKVNKQMIEIEEAKEGRSV